MAPNTQQQPPGMIRGNMMINGTGGGTTAPPSVGAPGLHQTRMRAANMMMMTNQPQQQQQPVQGMMRAPNSTSSQMMNQYEPQQYAPMPPNGPSQMQHRQGPGPQSMNDPYAMQQMSQQQQQPSMQSPNFNSMGQAQHPMNVRQPQPYANMNTGSQVK